MMNYDPSQSRDQSDFIGGLGDAIRKDPLPAVLVGAGLLWLLMGRRDNTVGALSHTLLSGAGEGAMQGGMAVYRGARYAGHSTSQGIGRVAEGAADLGSRISEGSSKAAGAVTSAAGILADAVQRNTSEALEQKWSSHGGDSGGPSAERGVHDTLADLFARQPLLLGAVGLAIGAGIAASLPQSEAEDRLMGATAEAAWNRGKTFIDETQERISEATLRGLEEADAQGLTPEAAGNAARTIASRVIGVAERAGQDLAHRVKNAL